MSIPSQLPQLIAAAKSGALQALALQSGQMLEGKVIGPGPNGATRVEIRGQLLNLLMPTPMKAGEAVRFEVQGAGNQLKLVLQPSVAQTASANVKAVPQAVIPQAPLAGSVPSSGTTAVSNGVSNPGTTAALPVMAGAQPISAGLPAAPATSTPAAQPAALPSSGGNTPAPLATAGVPVAPQATAASAMPTGQLPIAAPSAPVPSQPAATPANPYPQLPPASAAPNPSMAQPSIQALPAGASPQPPQAMPATPQAALAQMVQVSLPHQGTIASLTSALGALAGHSVLPEPVARAAQLVMANRLVVDGTRLDGAALQSAIRGSGIFQEGALARGQTPLPQADAKSALLALRQTLTTWLGGQAQVAPIAQIPPPLRGSIPRARTVQAPPIEPTDPPEMIGKQLLERTEQALARIRLHQHASLPDGATKAADWSLELPVMAGQQQTLLHIQIHRDNQQSDAAASERGWQLRFAISLPDMGEVGAQISMRSGTTGVMLWASEAESASALNAELDVLKADLIEAGLKPGAVIVRNGAPQPPASPSGHFVDSRT